MRANMLSLLLFVATPALADPPVPSAPALNAAVDAENAFLAQRRAVSLTEALKLAEAKSLDLVAARAQADQIAAKSRLVYSALLPEVTMSASFVYTSAPAVFDQSAQTQLLTGLVLDSTMPGKEQIAAQLQGTPAVMAIQARESLFGNLIVQQVLFSPQFFLLPAAGESKEAARLGSLEAREQILLGVARVYLGVEGIAAIEQAARDAEQVALKRERDARSQQLAGVATDIAVLRAQSETAQARATLATLSGQRVALLAMLEALVGEPVRPIDGQPTQFDVTASDEDAQPWEATYLVKAQAMGLKSQERFNTFDRLAWMPTLVAQAKGSYNSNKGFVNTNWIFDGIIAAQWSLYDRGVRYAQLHENDAKTAEARAKLEGARAKARANWIGAKTNLQAAEVALQQADAQAQLATRAQKQVGSAFQAGFATSLEVSDIDNKRFYAASAAAQARAQYEIRKVELAAAEGRLAALLGLEAAPTSP